VAHIQTFGADTPLWFPLMLSRHRKHVGIYMGRLLQKGISNIEVM